MLRLQGQGWQLGWTCCNCVQTAQLRHGQQGWQLCSAVLQLLPPLEAVSAGVQGGLQGGVQGGFTRTDQGGG